MKLRISLLASVAVAMVLALVGVLNDVSTTRALMPLPIQPFASDAEGGVSSTQLGQSIAGNWTVTVSLQGERSALPWIFSGPGFTVDLDATMANPVDDDGDTVVNDGCPAVGNAETGAMCDDAADNMEDNPPDLRVNDGCPAVGAAETGAQCVGDYTQVGTVWTNIDAGCDGSIDFMALDCTLLSGGPPNREGAISPLKWYEATANKALLGSDAFLTKIMPPWPWLARHQLPINKLCLGTGGASASTTSVLNTVYAQVPFSPGGSAFVAQTKLGGSPNSPPSSVCLDSPQSSESITTIYNNPPLKGDTGGPTGDGGRALDDGSGLYARWTILQSQGSSSLQRFADLRKTYQNPPSLPSDTGYVERIIDLQCFWMDDNGCAGCDGADPDTAISEVESWNDLDLAALGGIDAVDKDRDCLMASGKTQPGWPAPVDTNDDPTGDPLCPVLQYSENPVVVQNSTAADTDCDGLVDGIEWAYGSNPTLVDTDNDGATDFVEMFQFTDPTNTDSDGDGISDKPENNYIAAAIPSLQCGNNWDDDGDGKINDGCPAVGAAETAGAQCNDNVDSDGDTVVNDGCVTSGTAEGSVTSGEAGEAANLDDNCPTVANPDQLNTDAQRRDNGPKIPGNYASNPNGDKMGDACDDDDDNDGVVDAYELSTAGGKSASDPLNIDTDGDTVNDAVEWRFLVAGDPSGDPLNPAVKPAWGNTQQVYYRGCHVNVNASYAGFAGYNVVAGAEMDPDGDGIVCPTDKDSDNGGLGHASKVEILDRYEAYGYNTSVISPDTDGDGCEDWLEIMDLNGDRFVDSGDQGRMNLRVCYPSAGCTAPDAISDKVYDVNKDTYVDSGDKGSLDVNNCGIKNWGGCPQCPSEN